MVDYTLTRSKRKTIALYVHANCVDVRAPLRMPKCEIDRFVLSKEKWIQEKLSCLNERAKRRESFNISYGDYIAYRNKKCPIVEKAGKWVEFVDDTLYVPPGLSPNEIKAACVRIYKQLAGRDINDKVQYFSEKLSVKPSAVKINSAKARWGSCSAKKSLNFSWRLIMGNDETIDYVVVHELAHIKQHNHSPKFWKIVEDIIPDYKKQKEKLKMLGEKLSKENWDLK